MTNNHSIPMNDFTQALPGTWFDDTSDETWYFTAEGVFEHEWHSEGDPHMGAYEFAANQLTLIYEGDLQVTWEIVEISSTTLTYRTSSGEYTLKRTG
jgi:hypothetical protein